MAQAAQLLEPNDAASEYQRTIDLAALAGVNRGDRIRVEAITDRTIELFERTIRVLDAEANDNVPVDRQAPTDKRFMPEHEDLRQRFIFAEALGSYATLQDLLDAHSPGRLLSQDYEQKVAAGRLTPEQRRILEDYHAQMDQALVHAHQYLLSNIETGFSYDEVHELNEVLLEARERCRRITAILGTDLIYEVEAAVQTLYDFTGKIHSVQKSIDGIFLIDSEVMFIPTNDLIDCVNTIFSAIGNPYVAEHVDGMLLLAARNLLIGVVSFYSYYGKHQIYKVFQKKQATVSRAVLAHQIRHEIKKLFNACRVDNRLMLTRVMNDAERDFEISVGAIQEEATAAAVEVVKLLIPEDVEVPPPPEKPGLIKRLASWMFR